MLYQRTIQRLEFSDRGRSVFRFLFLGLDGSAHGPLNFIVISQSVKLFGTADLPSSDSLVYLEEGI